METKAQAESVKDDLSFFFAELQFLEALIPEFPAMKLQAEQIIRDKF